MKWQEASWGGGKLQRTSDAPIPWKDGKVALIWISDSGVIRTTNKVSGKLEALEWAGSDDLLLVCWPGKWRQDIFLVDDRGAAMSALKPGPFATRGSVTPKIPRQEADQTGQTDRHAAMAELGRLLQEAS